jgi:hypothetical protein
MSQPNRFLDQSLAYVKYWRNSLADAALGKGSLKDEDAPAFDPVPAEALASGTLPEAIVEKYFEREEATKKMVEVVLRPLVYAARKDRGRKLASRVPDFLTPLVTPAYLARDGRLYPRPYTVVPRDLLDPLERSSFTIGTLVALDAFLTTSGVPEIEYDPQKENDPAWPAQHAAGWQRYRDGTARMLNDVCRGLRPEEEPASLVSPLDHGFIIKADSATGASNHILALYDHMRAENGRDPKKPVVPLFERYASEAVLEPEPCQPPNALFSRRLAHSSNEYPLAKEQRDALTHLLAAHEGEILAVNGPPGTGKTTLLLSVVACLWAKAALAKREPPVILAASANNQAVTNIIDAFGRDFAAGDGPFADRWLPGIYSFGAYFPSNAKKADSVGKYQTRDFFDEKESKEYYEKAIEEYRRAAKIAFPDLQSDEIQNIIDRIHLLLQAEAQTLRSIEEAWTSLSEARSAVREELGENPIAAQAARVETRARLEVARTLSQTLIDGWEGYLAQESIFYSRFAWFPPVARKRLLQARVFLKQSWPAQLPEQHWSNVEQIDPGLREMLVTFTHALNHQEALIQRGADVLAKEAQCLKEWVTALAPLGDVLNTASPSLADIDELADKSIRFRIFLLTTHYWEGRWLLDIKQLIAEDDLKAEKTRNGATTVAPRWRRRMKLTPCVVSTFYMLPSELKVSRRDRRSQEKHFLPDYLYTFADLLTVDEAGQVLPEVAGASFALARRALVIGDTLQIEPMWQIPTAVDIGNLVTSRLMPAVDNKKEYERLCELGKAVSTGSVMRIAQCATRYHYDPELARGMFLYAHRRCFDEIIAYCNRLSYHGKLLPLRGTKAAAIEKGTVRNDGLPPIGYLHIDGLCQQRAGGSRQNPLEAEVIAAWLAANRQKLQETYGRPLHEIVGVVTPFTAQARAIAQACHARNIRVGSTDGAMTVGTVHSLQGAERPVVIFSPTYSKHADGTFIDKRVSMLNVAVSRAKNAFLVFGDMDLFELAPRESPRGQLATLLFSDDAYELHFTYQPRPDLTANRAGVTQLLNAEEHDTFLVDVLEKAVSEVHIVTPWIRRGCVEGNEPLAAVAAMAQAVRKGVKVRVYTDYGSNTQGPDERLRKQRRQDLDVAVKTLKLKQIDVVFVWKVHSKIVIGDGSTYCVGSFNWLSARRDDAGARHETSLVYRGTGLTSEIETVKRTLARRADRFAG